MTMRGRIEYHFKCFGGCTVLFIEMKLVTGTAKERVNAIAQVIAECDGSSKQLVILVPSSAYFYD